MLQLQTMSQSASKRISAKKYPPYQSPQSYSINKTTTSQSASKKISAKYLPPHQSSKSFSKNNPKNKTLNLFGDNNRGEGVSDVIDDKNDDTEFGNKNTNDLLKIVFPRNY